VCSSDLAIFLANQDSAHRNATINIFGGGMGRETNGVSTFNTTINLLGGGIAEVSIGHNSVLNIINGGTGEDTGAHDNGIINLMGGYLDGDEGNTFRDNSVFNATGGEFGRDDFTLHMEDNSFANITGSTEVNMRNFRFLDNASALISGGSWDEVFDEYDPTKTYSFFSASSAPVEFQVRGLFFNGSPIDIPQGESMSFPGTSFSGVFVQIRLANGDFFGTRLSGAGDFLFTQVPAAGTAIPGMLAGVSLFFRRKRRNA